MKNNLPNRTRRKHLLEFAVLAGVIVLSQVGFRMLKTSKPNPMPEVVFVTESGEKLKVAAISAFNPNNLNESEWKKLGFSEKQVATILKYKEVVGGEFTSKEQIKKCYAISDEKYEELAPYILLPESAEKTDSHDYSPRTFEKKKLNISGKFNPDLLSESDWVKMGFSEGQAKGILNYKNYLGGSFQSKEKLKACYMISDERFAQMKPYLMLPENSAEPERKIFSQKEVKPKPALTYFDPNVLGAADWINLGFSEKQAAVIMNYKNKNLKGSFKTLEDIQKCFVISDKKFEELQPWIKLNPATMMPSENPELKQTSKPPVSATDFSKTDLNKISRQQLVEFGFSEKAAGSFVGFRKNLGGFVNKNQIFETYDIDRSLAEKLVSVAPLNSSSVEKYTLVDAPESWLRTHPYFKYSADKIIFYRISHPDEKKIWKFIKAKPEYEAKMRLYLQ